MGDIWGESAQSIETAVNSGGNINYLKLADGDIKKVRILGTLADGLMVRGWLSFGLDSKPIYKSINETIPPEMINGVPLRKYGNSGVSQYGITWKEGCRFGKSDRSPSRKNCLN